MQKLAENTAKVLVAGLGRGQRRQAHHGRSSAVPSAQRGSVRQSNIWPMKNFLARFIRSEVGVTAIEYSLIGALISVVCIAGMTLVGAQLTAIYAAISAAITPAL